MIPLETIQLSVNDSQIQLSNEVLDIPNNETTRMTSITPNLGSTFSDEDATRTVISPMSCVAPPGFIFDNIADFDHDIEGITKLLAVHVDGGYKVKCSDWFIKQTRRPLCQRVPHQSLIFGFWLLEILTARVSQNFL